MLLAPAFPCVFGWPTALLRVRACLSLAGLVVCYKPAVRRGSCCACPASSLFAQCSALEGLSHSETRASGGFRFGVLSTPSSRSGCQSVVAPVSVVSRPGGVSRVRGGSACGPSTLWRSSSFCSGRWGTGNPYWALFARLTPLLPSARGSSSRELGVGWVAEAFVTLCVVSSSESSCTRVS
ncbi:hypothetical protein Taro_053860 [Colocasia esculenta]|uniref:Secreted protein n=1 Tax=Colocasia esculenta TaxID=4460 RepID=A0A843XNT7_COLES|nr:hypothetical protein [Colocasia esculenta]